MFPVYRMMRVFLTMVMTLLSTKAFEISSPSSNLRLKSFSASAFGSASASASSRTGSSSARFGLIEDIQDGIAGFAKRFTHKASASHILIKGADSESKLNELLPEITADNFATYASKYSSCPSAAKGGALGTSAPGQMVKEFDKVSEASLPFGRRA